MKKMYYGILPLFMIVFASINFTACSNDSDDDPTNSGSQQTDKETTAYCKDIDLGLSVRWANCNVGATNPWEHGSYYAWGECKEKDTYTEQNYTGPSNRESISGSAYDAASQELKKTWRMPTFDEYIELIDNCTYEITTINNIEGVKFISKINGNSIFFPAAGWKLDKSYQTGEQGGYWAGTGSGNCGLHFVGTFVESYDNWTATSGMPIRAVTEQPIEDNTPTPPLEENNNGDTTTPDTTPTESEEIIGYWINSRANKYGINLYLNDDGTCHAETWSWSTSTASWHKYHVKAIYYWNYDKETKELVTSYESWQFRISLLNEYAMVGTKPGGNSNSYAQSWSKASNILAVAFILQNLNWIDSDNNSVSFENCYISEDENKNDMTYNYNFKNQNGKLKVTYPFSPARTTLFFSGAFSGKFTLQEQN